MLSSVFTNLLNNAVLHNDSEYPSVWVDVTVERYTASIRVADDGPGVPPNRRDEIFGRGEKGLESEGTGVGLYLVDTLTSEFGGDVWVEDSEHGGTAFVVTLPLAKPATEADAVPSETSPPAG
ncbi:MAG: signal transduction histidine kinase [Halobacteriales archaeon]|jgi:signal transduction histidine kinase